MGEDKEYGQKILYEKIIKIALPCKFIVTQKVLTLWKDKAVFICICGIMQSLNLYISMYSSFPNRHTFRVTLELTVF